MTEENLIQECPYPFSNFLKKVTDILIIIFDKQGMILDCNTTFTDLVGTFEGKSNIINHIAHKSRAELALPQDKGVQRQNLSFLRENSLPYKTNSFIYSKGDRYILFGAHRLNDNEEILNKLTQLNNELTNKSRELTKKNIQLERSKEKIEELLRTDHLTGLKNRKAFMEYLEKMSAQALRHTFPLTVIMLDLDRFKKINDTYGHSTGDKVLIALADILKKNSRQEDMAARIGGEEFLILLPHSDLDDSMQMAERIRQAIENMNIPSISENITASFGVTIFQEGDDFDSILNRVDNALYKAKAAGRNKVEKII
ncbi:MAG: GGDEF domain-containing protein [Bacillota bacterium]